MDLVSLVSDGVQKIGFWEIQLIKLSSLFFGLWIAKLIPGIMNTKTSVFFVLVLIFGAYPVYVAYFK